MHLVSDAQKDLAQVAFYMCQRKCHRRVVCHVRLFTSQLDADRIACLGAQTGLAQTRCLMNMSVCCCDYVPVSRCSVRGIYAPRPWRQGVDLETTPNNINVWWNLCPTGQSPCGYWELLGRRAGSCSQPDLVLPVQIDARCIPGAHITGACLPATCVSDLSVHR